VIGADGKHARAQGGWPGQDWPGIYERTFKAPFLAIVCHYDGGGTYSPAAIRLLLGK
jgi:hypothetical protein